MPPTPMMAQFLETKARYPQALLLFRMGDFYELFLDDAKVAAAALDIALTHRGQHEGKPLPMCGVPVHSGDSYLAQLIRKGFCVAICEQVESPAEARRRGGSKAIVKREVVRVVTPGTLTDDSLLESRSSNYLAAVAHARTGPHCALAWVDISNGEFAAVSLAVQQLSGELARLSPREILYPERDAHDSWGTHIKSTLPPGNQAAITPRPNSAFDPAAGRTRIERLFSVTALDAFGGFGASECAAMGAILDYLDMTQQGQMPHLLRPRQHSIKSHLQLDATTLRSLEVTHSLAGSREGSLLAAIDHTVTAAGGRLLEARLVRPELDLRTIHERHDLVGFFVARPPLRESLRALLRRSPDMDRALSRLAVRRAGPRDLGAIRDGLVQAHEIAALLARDGVAPPDRYHPDGTATETLHEWSVLPLGASFDAPSGLSSPANGSLSRNNATRQQVSEDSIADTTDVDSSLHPERLAGLYVVLTGAVELRERLVAALKGELSTLPFAQRDGGFVAPGYHRDLDRLCDMSRNGQQIIAGLEARYREETAIVSLRIRHNNILGYYVEIPSSQLLRLQGNDPGKVFIHRQTTVGHVRFATEELSTAEINIRDASEKIRHIEAGIFDQLTSDCLAHATTISRCARGLAALDVVTSLAELAHRHGWVRPLIENSRKFDVSSGRHPVVEASLAGSDTGFVANDCHLPEHDLGCVNLVTGPNMAGKSTWLRQNALIPLLAQSGSFVPAERATIGLVSQIFSRVGAADEIARGRSTFMVEMLEAAAILNQADERAFVIVDEIGRGTATWDGLAIAWACVEHLHRINRCRVLFATHYRELTSIADELEGVTNSSMAVREWDGKIVFLHEVHPGPADRSFGIQVARLAGMPAEALQRAEQLLQSLEGAGGGQVIAGAVAPVSGAQSDLFRKDTSAEGGNAPQVREGAFNVANANAAHRAAAHAGVREAGHGRYAGTDINSEMALLLADLRPDELTPKEALEIIYDMKKRFENQTGGI